MVNLREHETPTQQYLQFNVSQLMKYNEISRSVDPFRVLQKTMEKQNEELVLLTLTIPKTEETKSKIQLLLQICRQFQVSS